MEEDRQEQGLQNQERRPLFRRFSRAQTKEGPEKSQRIKTWMAACMVAAILTIEAVQALLTLVGIGIIFNSIITIGATFLFSIWYLLLGISPMASSKKLATMLISSFGDLIPILNTLPILTLGVVIMIVITKMEDSGGIMGTVASAAKGEVGRLNKAT